MEAGYGEQMENRDATALLVIDVQVGVMEGSYDSPAVIARIASLVDRARDEGVPVVWVQHSNTGMEIDTDDWQIVPELVPAPGEAIVRKTYGDSFEDTDLESVLAGAGVGRLVVTGAQTDACVRSTIHGGFARGYDVTLVSDAHTTEDLTAYGAPEPAAVIAHTNLYWEFQGAPGRQGEVATAAEVTL